MDFYCDLWTHLEHFLHLQQSLIDKISQIVRKRSRQTLSSHIQIVAEHLLLYFSYCSLIDSLIGIKEKKVRLFQVRNVNLTVSVFFICWWHSTSRLCCLESHAHSCCCFFITSISKNLSGQNKKKPERKNPVMTSSYKMSGLTNVLERGSGFNVISRPSIDYLDMSRILIKSKYMHSTDSKLESAES